MLRKVRWSLLLLGAIGLAIAYWSRGREAVEPPPVIAQLPSFELTSHTGAQVSLDDLRGRPWVADLIFTRCPMSCPRMTEVMNALGPGLADAGGARRVSISVDPEHDTPEILAEYAARRGISDPDWLFLTGDLETISGLAAGGFLLPFEAAGEGSPGERVLHSTRFVLLDSKARIRGYYDPFEPGGTDRLLADLTAIHRTE